MMVLMAWHESHSPAKHARAAVTVCIRAHEQMVSSKGNDGQVSEWKEFQELRSPGGAMFCPGSSCARVKI